MQDTGYFVIFSLDKRLFAIDVASIERSLQALAYTPLPGAPPIVDGAINIHGRILPVINLRRRLGLQQRAMKPSDYFLIAQTKRRLVALLVDRVLNVMPKKAERQVAADEILADLPYIEGVIKTSDGLILIQDIDSFLALEEHDALDRLGIS